MNWQTDYKAMKQVVYALLKAGDIDGMLEANDKAEAFFWEHQPLGFVGWEYSGNVDSNGLNNQDRSTRFVERELWANE